MDKKVHQAASSPKPSSIKVEIPTDSSLSFNPLDPNQIKIWEEVGPIGSLVLLCLLIWLLTRFVEAVKSK